jgi:hypothetical protein
VDAVDDDPGLGSFWFLFAHLTCAHIQKYRTLNFGKLNFLKT